MNKLFAVIGSFLNLVKGDDIDVVAEGGCLTDNEKREIQRVLGCPEKPVHQHWGGKFRIRRLNGEIVVTLPCFPGTETRFLLFGDVEGCPVKVNFQTPSDLLTCHIWQGAFDKINGETFRLGLTETGVDGFTPGLAALRSAVRHCPDWDSMVEGLGDLGVVLDKLNSSNPNTSTEDWKLIKGASGDPKGEVYLNFGGQSVHSIRGGISWSPEVFMQILWPEE